MLLERIYEWARSQPKKTAIIYNDIPIDYASFSRTIDAARRFLEPQALSVGRTAVLFNSPLDGWSLLLALRSLGDGRIRILGRVDDVVNAQGIKYAVGPIEHEIQQLLGVDEV